MVSRASGRKEPRFSCQTASLNPRGKKPKLHHCWGIHLDQAHDADHCIFLLGLSLFIKGMVFNNDQQTLHPQP